MNFFRKQIQAPFALGIRTYLNENKMKFDIAVQMGRRDKMKIKYLKNIWTLTKSVKKFWIMMARYVSIIAVLLGAVYDVRCKVREIRERFENIERQHHNYH